MPLGFGAYALAPFMARATDIIDPPGILEVLTDEDGTVLTDEDGTPLELEEST